LALITLNHSAASHGAGRGVESVKDLNARWFVPMHYGTFKLSFEDMDEPPRLLRELAAQAGLTRHLKFFVEGAPEVF